MFPTILILCVVIYISKGSEFDYDGPLNFNVYLDLEENGFSFWKENGLITVSNFNSGNFNINLKQLEAAEKNKLQELCNKNLLYKIKLVSESVGGEELAFHSFGEACSLINSFVTTLIVHIDHKGSVIGTSIQSDDLNFTSKVSFGNFKLNFNAEFSTMEKGPIPSTAVYISKLEKEKEAKDKGVTPDNRSFFAKYWMYIIPFLIVAALQSAAMPDNNQNR